MALPAEMFSEIVGSARGRTMAWFRIQLTEEQQQVVNEEQSVHINLRI